MNKTTEALNLSEKACFAGKECEALLAKLCVKLGMPDIASEFLDPGVFDRAITALQEALDHSGEANEMVQPVSQERIEEHHALTAGNRAVVKESLTAQEQDQVAWHHPECEGECIACLIERAVKDAYGSQGVAYMLRHINNATVRTKDMTPHEITALIREGAADGGWQGFAQRVIAADRKLNGVEK